MGFLLKTNSHRFLIYREPADKARDVGAAARPLVLTFNVRLRRARRITVQWRLVHPAFKDA